MTQAQHDKLLPILEKMINPWSWHDLVLGHNGTYGQVRDVLFHFGLTDLSNKGAHCGMCAGNKCRLNIANYLFSHHTGAHHYYRPGCCIESIARQYNFAI